MLTELDYVQNVRTVKPRTYQLSIVGHGSFLRFRASHNRFFRFPG
jgi:hypothetical protein